MKTNIDDLTSTQRVAIYWLKNIESPLILYKQIKRLPQAFRYFLYAALIVFSYFALKFASFLIGGYFDAAPISGVWYFLGDIIFYSVITGMLPIFTLESLSDCDIPQIFADIKAKAAYRKTNKLQRWRLRNMNIFVRILLYISFYVFCVFVIHMSSLDLFINIFAGAAANEETYKQMNEFRELVINFIRWFTFVYLAGGLTLEYFINKVQKTKANNLPHTMDKKSYFINKVQKTKEVQNETVTA